jgi:hypothetical protein
MGMELTIPHPHTQKIISRLRNVTQGLDLVGFFRETWVTEEKGQKIWNMEHKESLKGNMTEHNNERISTI